MNGPVRKRRWILRSFVGLFALALTAVILAPSLLEWFPELRNWGARKLFGKLNGDVVVDDLSAGWFHPIVIKGVHVKHASGESLVDVERIETDRTLWRIVTNLSDVGTIRIERPVVSMAIRSDGNNFNDVFAPVAAEPKPPRGLKLGVRARVVDGTFRCRSHEYAEPWEITGINLGVGLRPASVSSSGQAELLVEKGYLLHRAEASVGLCNDLLSYIAPVLAKVTYARGELSIYLDDWRLPLETPENGELSGLVTMHTVDAAPGPLTQALFHDIKNTPIVNAATADWQLPEVVQLARESQIPFKMQDGGKIHHTGMQFSMLGLVDVATDGDVGLDKSLNLTAVLGFHPPNPQDRKLAVVRTLYTQPWPIHIRGELGKPIPDLSSLGDAGIDLVTRTLDDIQAGNPSVGGAVFNAVNNAGINISPNDVKNLINTFRPQPSGTATAQGVAPEAPPPTNDGPSLAAPANQPPPETRPVPPDPKPPTVATPATPPTPAPSSTPATNAPVATTPVPTATPSGTAPPVAQQISQGVGIAVDVLQALRQQREARMREQMNQPPPGNAPPGPYDPNLPPPPPQGPLGRRPVLRNGLRSLFETIDNATQNPQPFGPPAATPSATPTATPSATPGGTVKAREF